MWYTCTRIPIYMYVYTTLYSTDIRRGAGAVPRGVHCPSTFLALLVYIYVVYMSIHTPTYVHIHLYMYAVYICVLCCSTYRRGAGVPVEYTIQGACSTHKRVCTRCFQVDMCDSLKSRRSLWTVILREQKILKGHISRVVHHQVS
jgi:hypothetical protein